MSSFEKQRDVLVQEIAAALDSVINNMDILNRSLHDSVQVGKDFDDVGRLWSRFYLGLGQDNATLEDAPAAEAEKTGDETKM